VLAASAIPLIADDAAVTATAPPTLRAAPSIGSIPAIDVAPCRNPFLVDDDPVFCVIVEYNTKLHFFSVASASIWSPMRAAIGTTSTAGPFKNLISSARAGSATL
jgi:hypothetical protein